MTNPTKEQGFSKCPQCEWLGLTDEHVKAHQAEVHSAAPSSKPMTDREMLRVCLGAIRESHKMVGRTDWSLMIDNLRRHLEESPDETTALSTAVRDLLATECSVPAPYCGNAMDPVNDLRLVSGRRLEKVRAALGSLEEPAAVRAARIGARIPYDIGLRDDGSHGECGTNPPSEES